MALTFSVDLDALAGLQRALNALADDLAGGPAGVAAGRGSLDPRVDLLASMLRANPEAMGSSAYGALAESHPLGQAHEEVARTVHALVDDLRALIDELQAGAAAGARRYADADAEVHAAILRAGGGLGGVGRVGAGGGGWGGDGSAATTSAASAPAPAPASPDVGVAGTTGPESFSVSGGGTA